MDEFTWIERALLADGLSIPPSLEKMIRKKRPDQGAFFFLNEEWGMKTTETMNQISAPYRVIAFGRRKDYDGVICVIVSDPEFAKGQVVELDDDRPRDYPVDVTFPSLAAWTQWAEDDLAYWIAQGVDKP